MAIVYKNSKDFGLYEDEYFDAPRWDDTASYESFNFTVKSYPFDFYRAGIDSDLAHAFRKNNVTLTPSDTDEIASFTEKFINESGVNPTPTSCIAIQDDRIVQVIIHKDKRILETYRLSFVFEYYSEALIEAIKNGGDKEVPIGQLPENTMVYLPYPKVQKTGKSSKVVGGSDRYAMILPADIETSVVVPDSQLIMKSTGKDDWLQSVTVTRQDLKNTSNELQNADLFKGESHLTPSSFCYVDKNYRVKSRGTIRTGGKKKEIRDAVLRFSGKREITILSANGIPDPQLYTEMKDGISANQVDDTSTNNENNHSTNLVSESNEVESSAMSKIRNKVLIVLFN